MKTFAALAILTLLWANPARAERPCAQARLADFTQADYDSIARAKGNLSKEALEASKPVDQENACLSRRLLKKTREAAASGGLERLITALSLDDIPARMSRFVTQDEYDEVRDVILKVMAREFAKNAKR